MNETEILLLLKNACACFETADLAGYEACVRRAGEAAAALPEHGSVYGEVLLASSLGHLSDLDRRIALYEEAANYIEGESRVFPQGAPFCGSFNNAFFCCNPRAGRAEENLARIGRAVELFHRLTGGGKGTDACYRAHLAFYRGEIKTAREQAFLAFETAVSQGQELTALCAAGMLANMAKIKQDEELWRFAYAYIRSLADGTRVAGKACREQAQATVGMLDLSLGLLQNVPRWIREGDFGVVSADWGFQIIDGKICHGTFRDAVLTRTVYYSYSGKPVEALQIADAAQKVYGINDTVTNVYFDFIRAVCYQQIGDTQRLFQTLRRAADALAPDGLWLIAAEFAPLFGGTLYEAAAEAAPDAPGLIRDIGGDFWTKLSNMRECVAKGVLSGLTRREQQIARLIADGKTNTQIAELLCISRGTVKRHAENIYGKLGVAGRSQLARVFQDISKVELAVWTQKD